MMNVDSSKRLSMEAVAAHPWVARQTRITQQMNEHGLIQVEIDVLSPFEKALPDVYDFI